MTGKKTVGTKTMVLNPEYYLNIKYDQLNNAINDSNICAALLHNAKSSKSLYRIFINILKYVD